MKKIVSKFLILFLLLSMPIISSKNINQIGVRAAEGEYELTPVVRYEFNDNDNLGKDSVSGFDLKLKGNIKKTSDGISLDGSSYLYYQPIANKDITDNLDKFTITLWAKEKDVLSSHRFMLGTGLASGNTSGFAMGFYETNCAYIAPTGGELAQYASTFVTSQRDSFGPKVENYLSSTEWNLYTIMIQNGTSYFGVNGHLYAMSKSINISNIKNDAYTFTVGAVATNNTANVYNYFTGEIKDIRIYDDILTEDEFRSIYNASSTSKESIVRSTNIISIDNSTLTSENPYDFRIIANNLSESLILEKVNDLDVKIKLSNNTIQTAKVICTDITYFDDYAEVTGVLSVPGIANTNKQKVKIIVEKSDVATIWANTTFTDNMILQRNKKVKIFGYGGLTGKEVIVSFNGQVKTTKVSNKKWEVYLDPMDASNVAKTLTISYGTQIIEYKNVLVGEVLLCSGQSNMAITLQYILNKDTNVLNDYSSNNNYNKIRVLNIPYGSQKDPTIYDTKRCSWTICNNVNDVKEYSAYAMTVASNYQAMLGNNIPVGVIIAAVGGSCIEQWLDPNSMKTLPSYAGEMSKTDSEFYNSFIYNIAGYTISSIVWYQGEANSQPRMVDAYIKQFEAFVNHYRNIFEDEKLPIIVQQLVKFDNGGFETAYIREAQWNFMKSIDNVYTVCGFDTGSMESSDGIHPADKWILGKRVSAALAYAFNIDKTNFAVDNSYGLSPEITSAVIVNQNGQNIIRIKTSSDGNLITANNITGIEVEVNNKWESITGYVKDGYFFATTNYTNILGLRYNFTNGYENGVYVYNSENLPLAPSNKISVSSGTYEDINPPMITPKPDMPSDNPSEIPSDITSDIPSEIPSSDTSEIVSNNSNIISSNDQISLDSNTNKGCNGSINSSLLMTALVAIGLLFKKKKTN